MQYKIDGDQLMLCANSFVNIQESPVLFIALDSEPAKAILKESIADNSTREELAAYAHEAWSGWMNYQFGKTSLNDDGTWTMPVYFVERWHRQMTTLYADLPESEKASDRAEADKMLAIINNSIPVPAID